MVRYVLFHDTNTIVDIKQTDKLIDVIKNYIKDSKVHVSYYLQRKYQSDSIIVNSYSTSKLFYKDYTLFELIRRSFHSDILYEDDTQTGDLSVLKGADIYSSAVFISVKETPNVKVQLFIKILDGRTVAMSVSIFMKISELKELIDSVCPLKLRLICNGKQLEDDHTLEECKLINHSTIHCMLRLRAGMFHESSGTVRDYTHGYISINNQIYRSNLPVITKEYIDALLKLVNEDNVINPDLLLTNPAMLSSLPKDKLTKLISLI